jgi:hypothetical protein
VCGPCGSCGHLRFRVGTQGGLTPAPGPAAPAAAATAAARSTRCSTGSWRPPSRGVAQVCRPGPAGCCVGAFAHTSARLRPWRTALCGPAHRSQGLRGPNCGPGPQRAGQHQGQEGRLRRASRSGAPWPWPSPRVQASCSPTCPEGSPLWWAGAPTPLRARRTLALLNPIPAVQPMALATLPTP